MPAPHVFVADVDGDRPALAEADRHHLARVLRLRAGDELTICDGRGRWRPARLGPNGAAVEPTGEVVVERAPSPPIAVAFALVKGERPEWVVQRLTELGVDRIIPFAAARSVVRWSEPGKHVERLRRVAHEAACQSHRAWLPEVEDVATFADLAARPGAALADRDGTTSLGLAPLVLVGPEGGWSDEERSAPLPRMRLGPHVLRAETASVAVGALLAAMRDGIVAQT